MGLDIAHRMVVREVMSSPALTVSEEESIVHVAQMMAEADVGAIIVSGSKGEPVGIVTERDIVIRVVAKGAVPERVRVKEAMSSPLRVVAPEMSLIDAMGMMSRLNIRRLGVTYKGELMGVITEKDILRIVPTVIEIVRERARIMRSEDPAGPSLVGSCDRCGIYSTDLRSISGDLLCEDCRADSETEV